MTEDKRLEADWMARAQQGDTEAFEQLLLRYEKRVFSLALRICGNPQDAQEAAQEAFLSAWQGLSFFRGDASFSTWLYRLTSNACVDLLRREGRHRSRAACSLDDEAGTLDPPDPAPSPQEAAEQQELRQQIQEGLQSLSLPHRQVLVLRELHQLTYDEIAATLDLDVGTVKSRINRARRQLRKFFVQHGNFPGVSPSKQTETEDRS